MIIAHFPPNDLKCYLHCILCHYRCWAVPDIISFGSCIYSYANKKNHYLFLYLSLFYRVSTVASSAAWILLFLLRFCWNCVDFINWFGANKNICNTIIIYKYYHIIYAYAYIFMFMLYIILYYYITIFTVLSVVSIIYVSHQSFIHFCYVLFLDASISLLLCLKSCSLLYFLSCYC